MSIEIQSNSVPLGESEKDILRLAMEGKVKIEIEPLHLIALTSLVLVALSQKKVQETEIAAFGLQFVESMEGYLADYPHILADIKEARQLARKMAESEESNT